MALLRFEWDGRKAAANRRKHGVSFEEAQSVFLDERALLIPDPDHSDAEDRFVLLDNEHQPADAGCLSLLPPRVDHPHHFGP